MLEKIIRKICVGNIKPVFDL